jgi:glycosyltransferase involved in cell wall biosynthesis
VGHERHVGSAGSRRLLYVVNDTPYFVLHWLERALASRDRGYETHVAGSPGAGVDRLLQAGLTFHPVSMIRGRFSPLREARTFRALRQLYQTLRPDLVHHITIKPVIYGTLTARHCRIPAVVNTVPGLGYVFSQAGVLASVKREAVKTAYRAALGHARSKVIFENPDDLEDFLSWRLITPGQGQVIKGAGVDLARFTPAVTDEAAAPTVVLAARLLWDKGVGVFVEAAARVKQRHPRARMVIVGVNDPASPSSIAEEQLREWVRSGLVEWWGHRSDMPDVLAAATIVCLPSFYREGVPRVLIEAAACGRPIVTTDMAGCREIVHPGDNGLLVPPRDPSALAAAIIALLDDPDERRRMGDRGRVRAQAEYAGAAVISQTLTVYDQLLADRSAER